MSDFHPAQHRVVPQRGFEDLKVGERFALPSRTITDANFAAFQTFRENLLRERRDVRDFAETNLYRALARLVPPPMPR